jgi:serine protease
MRNQALLLALALGASGLSDLNAQDFLERNIPPQPSFVPGQVIVKMLTDVSLAPARLTVLGLDSTISTIQQTSGGEFIYQIPPAVMGAMAVQQARDRTLEIVDSLREDPNVEYAQPNYRLYIVGRAPPARTARDLVPNDPRWTDQWHYRNNGTGPDQSPGGINLPAAWQTTTGADVVASILDTGILPDHPDITGSPNLLTGYDMISDPTIANDGDARDGNATDPGDAVVAGECDPGPPPSPPIDLDDSWHGTHVAGTVGVGNSNNGVGVAGVNWTVKVLPVRVLGKCGGLTSDINDAIRWAAGLAVPGVPANTNPAKVISMSLGSPPGLPCTLTPATQAAIDDAVAAGATVVVAAGNSATDAGQVIPASCDNVITVAASDARGYLATRYSNYGATIEILAPGGETNRYDNNDGNPDGVLSMVHPDAGSYAFYNGTSMAAPHVAGVTALWLAVNPSLSPAQLLSELQASALPRSSDQCPRPCGAGLLNAAGGPIDPGLRVIVVLDDNDISNDQTTTATATVVFEGTGPARQQPPSEASRVERPRCARRQTARVVALRSKYPASRPSG